ncbi:hypothetical protein N0V86_000821 [Didymella sp. IMI 355093]|nr:hypothetical protein N0V86_000821 [Didymella sp. IMI 355093]
MGFFTAPVEALPEISITDVYFTHERGTYMGVYALTLAGSNYFAPIISGFIAEGQGWQWVFYWPAIFNAVTLVFLFCCLEETNYNRASPVGSSHEVTSVSQDSSKNAFSDKPSMPSDASGAHKKSLAQRLSIWQPSPGENMLIRAKRSLAYLGWPVIFYAGFSYGSYLIWFNVLNATASIILGGPPYNFKASMVL